MAVRGYFTSPFHDEPWIESHLDLRDRDGNHLPGYGWIFPVGDGTVNVGVGLLSTFTGWKTINTSMLMDAFVATAPARWGISPETSCGAPTGGKLPTGGSVTPNIGPTWLVVGDAAGSVNPFNGEGISLAYETGRHGRRRRCRPRSSPATASRWRGTRASSRRSYGLYWKVARVFVRAIGNPAVMRELTRVGMQSRPLMEWVLRIMANLLRPDELGPAEAAYKMVAAIVAVAPEPCLTAQARGESHFGEVGGRQPPLTGGSTATSSSSWSAVTSPATGSSPFTQTARVVEHGREVGAVRRAQVVEQRAERGRRRARRAARPAASRACANRRRRTLSALTPRPVDVGARGGERLEAGGIDRLHR